MAEIFISYAHADDQPLAEGTKGWVTALCDRLQKSLAMQPGGSGVTVWMDHRLEPQKQVDKALNERVGRADCFVAVLSPRYLESRWCRQEIEEFVRRVGPDAGRVFLVEIVPTARAQWPAGTGELSSRQFWSQAFDEPAPATFGWPAPDPAADRPYWRALNELAHFISGQLESLGRPASVEDPAQRRVWIADPSDHVLDLWEQLGGALRQQGQGVLPQSPGQYPTGTEADYRAALDGDLSRADLVVQLLGPHPGRRPPWSEIPYIVLQANAMRSVALKRELPSFVWRSPDVRLDAVVDAAYRQVVTGASTAGFESFQQEVLARAAAPRIERPVASLPRAASSTSDDAPLSICVNADAPDRALGQRVRDMLFELGADATLAPEPAPDQPPAQWRQDYESMLDDSHGIVIIYGATAPSWVQAQVRAARKLLARTRRGTWGALLDGPPGQQPDHGVRSHSLVMLDCRGGVAPELLSRFLTLLRGSGSAADDTHV